jgi:hypothetical protein
VVLLFDLLDKKVAGEIGDLGDALAETAGGLGHLGDRQHGGLRRRRRLEVGIGNPRGTRHHALSPIPGMKPVTAEPGAVDPEPPPP